MKSYPYIGELKSGSGGVVLFSRDSFGAQLNDKGKDWKSKYVGVYIKEEAEEWNESAFKNITTEYLANTYGEVKSKAHAEFIVKLAEGSGYELFGSVSTDNAGAFAFDGENKILFFMRSALSLRGGSVLKQITIPLPPELNTNTPEEDFEMQQIERNDDETPFSKCLKKQQERLANELNALKNNGDNLMFGGADKCKNQVPESDYSELLKRFEHMRDLHVQISTITQLLMHDGVDVEKLLSIGSDGYNMPYSKEYMDWRKHTIAALTKVINVGDGNCEWPCVNDEVQTNFGKGVVKLLPDTKACYVIEVNGNYHQLKRDELTKPKTPEEELRDSLLLLWEENNHDFDMFLDVVTAHITKKPQ